MTMTTTPGSAHSRDVLNSALRGARNRCPHCGEGRLFRQFLKVNNHCPECSEALYHHRADDASPYVVITIVGHIVVGAMLFVEKAWAPDMWIHAAMWVPLTIVLSLMMMQPIKGALIGVQWALRMHGFDPASSDALEKPPASVPALSG